MSSTLRRRLVITATVLLALVAIYAAVGFWGVPYLVKTQAEKFVAEQLKRQATIGEARFNPFTLALEIKDFSLKEADGTPIASAARAFVDYELWPLLRKTFAFKEIALEQPQVNVVIDPNGSMNFARLAADLPKGEEKLKSAEVPRIEIARLSIDGAGVDFADARPAPPFATKINPVNILLTDFSTLPNQEGKYEVAASTPEGEKLKWVGDIGLAPINSEATLEVSGVSLRKIWSYLQDRLNVEVRGGTADLALAYTFDYGGTEPQLQVRDGKLNIKEFGLHARQDKDQELSVPALSVSGIAADLAKHEVSVGQVLVDKGKVVVQRGPDNVINWVRLLQLKPDQHKPIVVPGESASTPAAAGPAAAGPTWKLAVKEVRVQDYGVAFIDQAARSPYQATVGAVGVDFAMNVETLPEAPQVALDGIQAALNDIALKPNGEQEPILTLPSVALGGGRFDLKARTAQFDALNMHGARIRVWLDKDKQLNWLGLMPASAAPATPAAAPAMASEKPRAAEKRAAKRGATPKRPVAPTTPAAASTTAEAPRRPGEPQWNASIRNVTIEDFAVEAADLSGARPVKLDIEKIRATLKDVGTDLNKAVAFDAGLSIKQGGQLTAQGSAVPGIPSAEGSFNLRELSLSPAQGYVNEFARLKLVSGGVNANGKFSYGVPAAKSKLLLTTDARITRLDLKEEETNERFLGWDRLDLSGIALALEPNRLEITDVVVNKPEGKFIIYPDRTLNIQRIMRSSPASQPAAAQPAAPAAKPKFVWAAKKDERKPAQPAARSEAERQAAELHERFPLSIRRIKVVGAQMLFSDLSTQPQFTTRIHSMNGNVNGLSSRPDAKAQMNLEGAVDEFGLARFEGGLNPLVAKKYTDVTATFRNLELTSVTPYSARFAGYRVASGKLNADLKYSINNSQLQGANKFVVDNLQLGERVESPDALKLPLELALALLKDPDGRIDLDLPVSGNLDDPEFSYGAIVWKAIVNVLTKIVTAPFRALGALLGVGGDKQLDSIIFDPGSERILPPEKEKLKHIAAALEKRPQLKLAIKAGYSEQDAQAIKSLRVRTALAPALGIKLEAGEDPGQIDPGDEKAGKAIESLYRQRFGREQFNKVLEEQERAAAEGKEPTREQRKQARARLPETLLAQLIEREALSEEELKGLGERRAEALKEELLTQNGVATERVTIAPVEKLTSEDQKAVGATFGLSAS
jgi:outer membrane protein OmpA-like peptidoglycan-associated protein